MVARDTPELLDRGTLIAAVTHQRGHHDISFEGLDAGQLSAGDGTIVRRQPMQPRQL